MSSWDFYSGHKLCGIAGLGNTNHCICKHWHSAPWAETRGSRIGTEDWSSERERTEKMLHNNPGSRERHAPCSKKKLDRLRDYLPREWWREQQ